MKFSPQALVAAATPIFSAVSGVLTGWLARHFPGMPHIGAADLTAVQIAGAAAAAAAAVKWLHGQQKLVAFSDQTRHVIGDELAKVMASPQAGPALADIETVVKTHSEQIVTELERAVRAPAAVDAFVQALLGRLLPQQAPVAPQQPPAAPPAAPPAG